MPRLSQPLPFLLVLFSLLLAGTVSAQDSPWSLELHGTSAQLSGPWDLDDSTGLGLGLGYRLNRRWGLHLDATQIDVDGQFELEAGTTVIIETSFQMTPITARLDFHLTPEGRVDLYAGPTLGWIRFGDLQTNLRSADGELDFDFRLPLDDQFAWGGHLGVDVDLGRRAYLTGGATFLQSDFGGADFDEEGELDQWLLRAGVGFRF